MRGRELVSPAAWAGVLVAIVVAGLILGVAYGAYAEYQLHTIAQQNHSLAVTTKRLLKDLDGQIASGKTKSAERLQRAASTDLALLCAVLRPAEHTLPASSRLVVVEDCGT